MCLKFDNTQKKWKLIITLFLLKGFPMQSYKLQGDLLLYAYCTLMCDHAAAVMYF